MKLKDLIPESGLSPTEAEVDVRGLAYDSRRVQAGDLFAALVGTDTDGHQHVADAIARGAAVVLLEQPIPATVASLIVPNTRLALADVARRFYGDPATTLQTVGVTGTNGKTTTVHLVKHLMVSAGVPTGRMGTLGVAYADVVADGGLTTLESVDGVRVLASMRDAKVRAVAMEVSSHALSQYRVDGIRYDVGVFTNLSQDHLDFHGTLDAYFAAKARLFQHLMKPAGVSVLNIDDPRVTSLVDQLPRVTTFSVTGQRADVSVERSTLDADVTTFVLDTPDGRFDFRSPLVGRFNLENQLAALIACRSLGVPWQELQTGLATFPGVPGRLERVSSPGQPCVWVDYAHTPAALEHVLRAVRPVTRGRLWCVMGCGGDRDSDKRASMGQVVASLADRVVVTNDNPRSESPEKIAAAVEAGVLRGGAVRIADGAKSKTGYAVILDRFEAIAAAIGGAHVTDTVVIAGKGHETYQLIQGQTTAFDDREAARRVLAQRERGGEV